MSLIFHLIGTYSDLQIKSLSSFLIMIGCKIKVSLQHLAELAKHLFPSQDFSTSRRTTQICTSLS